jgi:hypothetical protein
MKMLFETPPKLQRDFCFCKDRQRIELPVLLSWALVYAILFSLAAISLLAQEPASVAPPNAPSNDFKNEIYAGGVYARGESGPGMDDTNFGGWNLSATHYFMSHLGATLDLQGLYGNAPVSSSLFPTADATESKYLYMIGPQIALHKTRRIASSLQLLAGVADTHTSTSPGSIPPTTLGLFPDATKFAFKPGGTFDVNVSSRFAVRYTGGVLLERENGDFQRDFDLSVGLVYKFGR